MRPSRPGELVCHCFAYRFPHRFGGGLCTGRNIVTETWNKNWGTGECSDCHCVEEDQQHGKLCQVCQGQEQVQSCPAWQDYIAENEIRLLGSNWNRN